MRRTRAGGILIFATAVAALMGACATGTDAVDLGDPATADAGPSPMKTDADVLNPQDSATNPGDSAAQDSGKDTSTPAGGHVVINELATGTEFCELYNPTSASVSLTGWEVRYASASGNAGLAGHKFVAGDTIAAKSFLLLQNSTWTDGLAAASGQLGLFDGPGTGATKVDGVAYGTVSAGTLNYGEGAAAPTPPSAGSIGRAVDGVDTDKNSADFKTFATPTPGASN